MKRIILYSVAVLLFSLSAWGQMSEAFSSGIEAYSQADYPSAINHFSDALAHADYPSAELYYNLGCAYFKNGDLPDAILNFERAYRMDPSDQDIIFNLRLASSRIVDKMDPVPQFFLTRWTSQFALRIGANTLFYISLVLFVVFLIGLFYLLRGKRSIIRKSGFFVGLFGLLLFIFSQVLLIQAYRFVNDKSEAILMSEIITVKSSPDHSAEDIVVVHSGLKVKVKQELGAYVEVKLPDGTIGWVPAKSIEIINQFEK